MRSSGWRRPPDQDRPRIEASVRGGPPSGRERDGRVSNARAFCGRSLEGIGMIRWIDRGRRLGAVLLAACPLVASAVEAWAGTDPASHGHAHGVAAGPAAHAPIGVMGDHTHAPGEVMFSYRTMRMRMEGSRDGDDRIAAADVLGDFAVTPVNMDMTMHMFGAMVAPVERFTLMVMVPYVVLEMNHRTRMGDRFTTTAEGPGDVRVTGLVDLWARDGHALHANVGLSIPTGSITETDRTPLGRTRLPYPMQIGSGTWDFLPGLTYAGERDALSWGAQARGEIRLHENHADYRLGNEYALTAWSGWTFTPWLSASLRTEWLHVMNHRGRDSRIRTTNPMAVPLVPTADSGRRAVRRLDVFAGVNVLLTAGPLAGVRLAFEAGLPAYQWVDGPQLETDWITTFGVQYAFD